MKERPILFSMPMVRAIMEGRKTQTRRIINPQPGNNNRLQTKGGTVINIADPRVTELCKIGHPGDRLWVREKCRAEELESGLDGVRYLADMDFREIKNTPEASDDWAVLNNYRGQSGAMVPSIHMPRWASRINLEIVSTRVERLQDISAEDAIAEGMTPSADGGEWMISMPKMFSRSHNPRVVFSHLWGAINGVDSWHKNPFVWVIDFKRIDPCLPQPSASPWP